MARNCPVASARSWTDGPPEAPGTWRSTLATRETHEETAYSLNQPGRILDVLEQCMADRLDPGPHGRSGWSSAPYLGNDLERHFGIRAPMPVIERALRDMCKRRHVQMMLDDAGVLWYRLVVKG